MVKILCRDLALVQNVNTIVYKMVADREGYHLVMHTYERCVQNKSCHWQNSEPL